jgi:cell division protein FtsZ
LEEKISVTIIATGFSNSIIPSFPEQRNNTTTISVKLEKEKNEGNLSSTTHQEKPQNTNQKTIEFDISEEEKQEKDEFESLYPNTAKKRSKAVTTEKQGDTAALSDEDVDELENIPAYKRRRVRMNDPNIGKKVSKFSVSKENKLINKNSYLFGKSD